MKKIASLIKWMAAPALFGISLGACNSEEPVFVGGGTDVENNTSIPGLPSDILGIFTYSNSTDIETNVWDINMSMGLFITKDSLDNPYENDHETYSNVKCVYTKQGWQTDPKHIKLSERPAVIYAYSPYRNEINPFAISVDSKSGESYMYGSHLEPQTSVRKNENIAKLHMKHVLALIDFRIRKADWDGKLVLQKVVIRRKNTSSSETETRSRAAADSLTALPVEGSLDLQTGVLTPTDYGQYESDNLSAVVTEDFNTYARFVQTVMPLDVEKDMVEVVFTVNGVENSIVLREDKDWTAGTRSIINLTFTGEGFEVEESITPWVDIEQDIIVNT